MKAISILAALPLTVAFVPTSTPRGRGLKLSASEDIGSKSYPFQNEPGGVKFFPKSPPYWDPLGLVEGKDSEFYYRLANGEIKNGRVAMLAVSHYIVTDGLGFRFPFELGGVSTADIPAGLGSFKAVPAAGWIQIFIACMLLDIGTDGDTAGGYNPNRVAGNVQPPTPIFKAPGDVKIRTKEINNGRLAMMAIMGMWASELVNNGELPFETLWRVLGTSS